MPMHRRSPPLPPLPAANHPMNANSPTLHDIPPELPSRPNRNKRSTEGIGVPLTPPSRPPTKPLRDGNDPTGPPPKLPNRPSLPKPPIATDVKPRAPPRVGKGNDRILSGAITHGSSSLELVLGKAPKVPGALSSESENKRNQEHRTLTRNISAERNGRSSTMGICPPSDLVDHAEPVQDEEDGAGGMYEVAQGGEINDTLYEVPTTEVLSPVGPNMGDSKQVCGFKLNPADVANARKNLNSLPLKEPVQKSESEKELKKPSPLPKPPNIKTQIVTPNNTSSCIASSVTNKPAPSLPPKPPINKVSPFEKNRESYSEDNSSAGSTSSGSVGPRAKGRLPLVPNPVKNEIQNCNSPRHPVPTKPPQSEPVPSLQEDEVYSDAISESLSDYDWYHGDIDRDEGAKRINTNFVNGTFLLRTSTKHMYALMVVLNKKVYNLIVRQRTDGKFAIGTEKKDEVAFSSVIDLVEHHKNSPVTVIGGKGNNVGVGSVKLCQTPPKK